MDYMARALALARQALGSTSPNPAVGAVVVRDGAVVGEGYTQPPGGPHAEVVALRQAGKLARGATVYVTLEPCCHFGRTPPCTQALVGAGVRAVHAATLDPNPRVAGCGVQELRAAGLTVVVGEYEAEARELNEAFLKHVTTGRPFLAVKFAMTLDGKIATTNGHSRWVTGPEARHRVHELRSTADAVLVGVGTVLADDPQLTVRLAGSTAARQPWRVVADSHCCIPLGCRLLNDEYAERTIVATTPGAPPAALAAVRAKGAEALVLAARDGQVDLPGVLEMLASRGVINILSEAGSTLTAALFAFGLVDKVYAFVAPKVAGGGRAPTPVGGEGIASMDHALPLQWRRVERLGDDLLLVAYPRAKE
ncbi:MAG: bifunctional diaminohydroxyphosphoribosylaminopyrimidine deaminase/5-amino-6-(5-phosphoribosylamino)uracil reductase RibD [Chloroflexi bacterium]|nr:bifunctional diaminohydroxyphosphoribosylaminopyrimidine deaminase/5-amino-6-(5-phosphoribosylamino)uracil reductase RibD [Chloroflexota bacterium]